MGTCSKKKNSRLSTPRYRRLVHIHQMIAEKRYPNCKTLAKDLEVAENTIRRDKDFLIDNFYADIGYDPSRKGFFYKTNFKLPLLETIQEKEIDILASSKTLLSHYKNTPLYEKAETLINTLTACGNIDTVNRLLDRIAVAPVPFTTINQNYWELIKVAMEESREVSFTYNNSSWDPTLTTRTVRPYQLVLDEGRCFLFGYLEERDDVRLFKLEKMDNLVITTKHFRLPEVYQFDKLCGGGKFGAFTRFTPKKYKIAFYEDAREPIRNGYWAEDQIFEEDDENDCTIITFTSSQDMRILDWVFENKAYAVPLEPKEFVEKWRYNIKVMAQEAGLIPIDSE